MSLAQLFKQDVINVMEVLKRSFEEHPIMLIAMILIFVILVILAHFDNKRVSKPDYIVRRMRLKMEYVYKGSNNSYICINKRYDGKIDIINEQGETMFSEIEDALAMSELIIQLKNTNFAKTV